MTAGTAASTPPEPGPLKRAGALLLFLVALAGVGAAVTLAFYVAASRLAEDEESEDGRGVAPAPLAITA